MKRYEYLSNEEVDTVYKWFKEIDFKNPLYIIPLIDKNPVFFLKTIINNLKYSRNKNKAITALVFLSMSDKKYCKNMFLQNFNKIIIDIRELITFLDKTSRLRGHGKVIKKAVYSWFRTKSINILKIEMKSNTGNTLWTNRDILNEFHIKPWNSDVSKLFKEFVESEKTKKTN